MLSQLVTDHIQVSRPISVLPGQHTRGIQHHGRVCTMCDLYKLPIIKLLRRAAIGMVNEAPQKIENERKWMDVISHSHILPPTDPS